MTRLIGLREAWADPLAKFKNPYEYAVSALRLTGIEATPIQAVKLLDMLDFRAFSATSPAGYGDTASDWAAPDAILKRIEWAHRLADQMPADRVPVELAHAGLGSALSATTRQVIEGAPSAADGIALLLASPEFQRR